MMRQHQAPVLDQVRQRDEEEEAAAIARLRHADDRAREVGADAELGPIEATSGRA